MTATFTIDTKGPFSLDTIRTFACGLFQASRACSTGDVALAFPSDEDFAPVGVKLRLDGAAVRVDTYGRPPTPSLEKQVARIVGLDHDPRPFHALLARDPVLARAGAAKPGFRPVVFYSPYAAAGWGILAQRARMTQAAAMLAKIARAAGDTVVVDGAPLPAFPRPDSVLRLDGVPGVPEARWRRLQGVARAALDGLLDFDRLSALPYDEARARLMELDGVGPWTADCVLLRGLGPTDALPVSEPSLARAVAAAYGLPAPPSPSELETIAEGWRPFRMWVSILLIARWRRAS